MNIKSIFPLSIALFATVSALTPLYSFAQQNPAEAESRKVVLQPARRGVTGSEEIRLNQLGFYPLAPKKAVVLTATAQTFTLEDSKHKVLFSGMLKPSDKPDLSGKIVFIADFTAFEQAGDYLLNLPEANLSYPVHINKDVHAAVAAGSIKAFYLIRASTPIPEQYAGKWQRAEGHPDTKVMIHPSAATKEHSAGSTISSPGGWYDAGDYNKYIVNSGISTATLLSLYEDFPDYMKTVKLNIPESNNQIPDVLDESLWNLRWMLTMQDPEDGGVYHKLTNAKFDGMIMPDQAVAARYVVQKSTAATLDFAAVMAQASRVFSKYDKQLPGLKDSCLKAAEKAWAWAAANPAALYDQETMNKNFSPAISTGTYGDNQVADEFIWAAAELYISTNDDKYLRSISIKSAKFSIPSWAQVAALGYYSLLRNKENLSPAGKAAIAGLTKKMIAFADDLADQKSQSAYQTVMGRSARDFNWGSSSNAANQGIALLQAYRLNGDKKYIDAALGNLDYLLGRNGTGYSFVSGFGVKPIMHPHHRTSVADGVVEPVPGLLSGGPNPGGQDHVATPSKVPDQAFVDNDQAYAVNEIAINWNAPFAYLANAIEALKDGRGYLK